MKKADKSKVDWKSGVVGFLKPWHWDYIEAVIEMFGVQKIAEFGSGISTVLFNDLCLKRVATWEDNTIYFNRWKDSGYEVHGWEGYPVVDLAEFEMVFVDGPWDTYNRGSAFASAIKSGASLIAVHDTLRPFVREFVAGLSALYDIVGTPCEDVKIFKVC